ncbi:helix-turn-helix domain-containing protein [Dermacoccus abyssi]|uniref:helix-turn-helix domain-containing protein n=1 Tax=Dermacoccus abyssi TaxID=322596 RepID=UPI0021A3A41F|nr:helix-turn-helix domain-containing protein [Dermacoccus abyssi]
MAQRFVQIADVAETLNVSARQVYGLVKSGELPAIKINNQWRVEADEIERYIERQYEATRNAVASGHIDDL